ncbi:hypothetical protein L3Q72_05320 [Vibrio sp. JC009]|uniref:hypothetical protein n=1 Tax=Vibrio sp. JC009 TaxID=2912314 RepID=UPI0023B14CFC|nr:hypothetical protein [Vibrio sp. JC009]WED22813.1 hypothetical protein L3Q72_05320 [Vibrio sp. JC009]
MIKKYNSLSFENIRSMRGKSLRNLTVTLDKLPDYSGVYIWRYWPQPKSYSREDLIEYLTKITKEYPVLEKEIVKYNDTMIYKRYALGSDYNSPFKSLNLTPNKINKLEALLDDEDAISSISNVFEMMVSMLPPLYIGKASNLSDRISQHVNRKSSKLLEKIDQANINYGDIYISFIKDELSYPDKDMSDLMEIIIQRVTNPVFTDRQG